MADPRSTAQSFISNNDNMMTTGAIGGERVRVAMRLRPMMPHETARNDQSIIDVPDG